MNCFYHPNVVAVGLCKSCSRGLCPACAADLDKGLACRGRCEENAQAVIDLIDGNIERAAFSNQMVDTARRSRYFSPIFQMVFGCLFLGFAAYQGMLHGFESSDLLCWGLGGAFLLFGFYTLLRVLRMPRFKPTQRPRA